MRSWDETEGNVIALLFAAKEPLSLRKLGCSLAVIEAINQAWHESQFPLAIDPIAGGFVLRTRAAFAPVVEAMIGSTKERLSKACLEVLAIVATKQPVARSEIEAIRGVDCSGLMQTLQDKELIESIEQEGSRIHLFQVTEKMLQHFGLRHKEELSLLVSASQEPFPAPGSAP